MTARNKQRVDVLLVERELAPSRARAQALVLAGVVYSADRRIEKAGQLVPQDAPLEVRGRDHPYVSRGGVKLAGALDALGLAVDGWIVADFGASTGGFTDCLLQRGAARVYAIDVGYGQLHDTLRNHDCVVVLERTNARHLKAGDLPEPMDLVVIDASFISLGKLLPAAIELLRPGGAVLGMVKPQFEVGRERLHKGVVRDPVARAEAIDRASSEALALGLTEVGRCDSVLAGPDGNLEAFLLLQKPEAAPENGPT